MGGGRRSHPTTVLDVLLAHGEATATTLAGELPVTRQAVAEAPRGPRPGQAWSRAVGGAARCASRSGPSDSTTPAAGWRASLRNGTAAGGDQAARRVLDMNKGDGNVT